MLGGLSATCVRSSICAETSAAHATTAKPNIAAIDYFDGSLGTGSSRAFAARHAAAGRARRRPRHLPERASPHWVLRQSGLMARGVTLHPRIGRAVRNLIAPRLLRIPRVRDAVAGSFAGTELRYAHGPGDSPLVGTRATEIPLVEGPLTHLQRSAGFVLIREHGAAPGDGPGVVEAERTDAGPAVLVRPDGYIAWAGASSDSGTMSSALSRWTGLTRRPPCASPRGG